MKKASIVMGDAFFNNNRLFDLNDVVANRDNCLYAFYLLRKSLAEKGVELATSDIHSSEDSIFVIYNEMPKVLPAPSDYEKSCLMLFESELIRPDNWDLKKHKAFKKIFTWNDTFVDNKKYFKMNFSHQLPSEISKSLNHKHKLCTLIAGNKKVTHSLELYSKRVEVIRWFEEHYSQDFDFYGMGWNEYRSSNKYVNFVLGKLGVAKWLKDKYPSYCGSVISKKEVLQKYKFSICYENARDIPGYITEKIFDCFFAGCVPVYWGANNITDYIPKNCFIDMRDFSHYEDMYQYMKSMTDVEYIDYLDAIELFLHSETASQFSIDFFVETIINNVCGVNGA